MGGWLAPGSEYTAPARLRPAESSPGGRQAAPADRSGPPCLSIFAEVDDVAPRDEIEALRAALPPNSPSEVVVSPNTRHGFVNDTRPNYHPEHAADAWARTLGFLRAHL